MKKAREKKKIRVSVQLYMVVAPLLLAVLFSGLIAEKLYRRTLTEEMVYTRLCSVQQVAKSIDMITAQIASIVTLISEDEQIKKCAVRLLVHRIRNTCN